jgi:DNA-binding IclR family transcriptional regulator
MRHREGLMDPSRYLNHSILRSLRILEAFAEPHPSLSIPEIARRVGLHRSTVHRLVVTLESAGWLRKLPGTEKYTLGIKVFTLGRIADQGISSCETVRPLLEDLAERTGETAILSMSDNVAAVCVDKIEASQRLKISSEIGQHFPLHAGATGFAVLLGMPEEQVRGFLFRDRLPSFTPKTETDPGKILERYHSLKDAGYVVSTGAVDPGVTGIAAPLFFAAENSYGSVGITMPEHRAQGDTLRKAVDAVLETASAMAGKIGFAGKGGEHS